MKAIKDHIKNKKLFFIAGPCVIENKKISMQTAEFIKELSMELNTLIIFKSSYLKANRTSKYSYRGPGLKKGLTILKKIKEKFNLPILTDIHEKNEAKPVSEIADVIQIPAFLSRQTELIESASRTKKWINIKKGQFMAPEDMVYAAEKAGFPKNQKILITERGTFFGYRNLVVDFRSIKIMHDNNLNVIYDATHSVQLPGGGKGKSSGQKEFIEHLSLCACSANVQGFFMEIHPNPSKALSDGPNMLTLKEFKKIAQELIELKKFLNGLK